MNKISSMLSSMCLGLLLSGGGQAATCSCAGVPLATAVNLDFQADQWVIETRYTYSDISLLIRGSDEVRDETGRLRETESLISGVGYGFNEHWSVTVIGSWVSHRRNIAISNQATEKSSGLGDMLLVLGYAPLKVTPFNPHFFALGVGYRIPVGADDNTKGDILYIEDMQPGQGAAATSLWLQYQYALTQKADWMLTVNGNFTDNQTNDRGYSFGSEWSLSPGVSWTMNESWQVTGHLNWREASRHSRRGTQLPNTGGQWLDFSLAASYGLTPSSAIGFSWREPLDRQLNDSLQFSTKRSFSVSYRYQF